MPQVLIVDEDRSVASALGHLFSQANLAFDCSDDLQNGIEKLQSHTDIAVLLTDHQGPDENHTNRLTMIRQLRPNLRVIIITRHTDTQALQRIINERLADQLIVEPWENEAVFNTVLQQLDIANEKTQSMLPLASEEDQIDKLKADVIERDRLLTMCLSTQHRYEHVIEQLPLGCVALSNEGLIIVANAQARELLNIEQGAVGLVVDQVLSPFLLASLDKASNEGSDIEWRNLRIQIHDLNDDRGRFGRILVIEKDANDDS